MINQWFDNWSPVALDERPEWQIEGLRETSTYIHSLLRDAVAEVGAKHVVLGGLSQGCAAVLIALLTWEGEPIAAAFGMCGWLPFRRQMEELARPSTSLNDSGNGKAVFEDPGAVVEVDGPTQGAEFLLEELEQLEKRPAMVFQRIPLFMGHGVEDEKVPVLLGRKAVSCLRVMGMKIEWCEYEKLGHWYSSEMLGGVAGFAEKAFTSGSKIDRQV